MKKTMVVVEDHALIRDLWVKIYEGKGDVEVAGATGDFEEAMELVKQHQPDLVSLDINLGEYSGADAVPLIRQQSPNTRIMAVSMHAQPNYLKQMLALGAMGYVTKSSPHAELYKAIDEICAGRLYVCEEMRQYVG
ncbi:MAG: response regulator transcription factor [Bacteroidetes bacterium]|nr:response regulator transcription factor [Bacteroidota bacterium]